MVKGTPLIVHSRIRIRLILTVFDDPRQTTVRCAHRNGTPLVQQPGRAPLAKAILGIDDDFWPWPRPRPRLSCIAESSREKSASPSVNRAVVTRSSPAAVKESQVENREKFVFAKLELFVSNAGMAFSGQLDVEILVRTDDRREPPQPPQPGRQRADRNFSCAFCSWFEIDFSFGNAGRPSLLAVTGRRLRPLDFRDCRFRARDNQETDPQLFQELLSKLWIEVFTYKTFKVIETSGSLKDFKKPDCCHHKPDMVLHPSKVLFSPINK
jgi:hypothetical protein